MRRAIFAWRLGIESCWQSLSPRILTFPLVCPFVPLPLHSPLPSSPAITSKLPSLPAVDSHTKDAGYLRGNYFTRKNGESPWPPGPDFSEWKNAVWGGGMTLAWGLLALHLRTLGGGPLSPGPSFLSSTTTAPPARRTVSSDGSVPRLSYLSAHREGGLKTGGSRREETVRGWGFSWSVKREIHI